MKRICTFPFSCGNDGGVFEVLTRRGSLTTSHELKSLLDEPSPSRNHKSTCDFAGVGRFSTVPGRSISRVAIYLQRH